MRDERDGSLNRREVVALLAAAATVPLFGRHALQAAEATRLGFSSEVAGEVRIPARRLRYRGRALEKVPVGKAFLRAPIAWKVGR